MFLQLNPLRKVNFLHGYDILFRDSCIFPYTNKLLKVSDHFVEKVRHESTTLSRKDRNHMVANMFLNPILDGGGANLPPAVFLKYSSETIRCRKLKLCHF